MTGSEFLSLAKQMFSLTPYSSKPYQKLFLRTITKDPKALEEARSFFPTGDALYSATNSALTQFVAMQNYGSSTQKAKELRTKVQKQVKQFKENKK